MRAAQTFVLRLMLCAGCAGVSACATGCTTAAIASAGTMVGLAPSAVSTGADVYQLGKLDSADQARFDDTIAAVRAAAADLHLKMAKESRDNAKGQWGCTLVDERGSGARVIVQRRTETLCRTRIDVGWFGSEPTARLILSRIRAHAGSCTATTTTTADDGCVCPQPRRCGRGRKGKGVGGPSKGPPTPEDTHSSARPAASAAGPHATRAPHAAAAAGKRLFT